MIGHRRARAEAAAALPVVLDRVAGNLRSGDGPLLALREAAAGADVPAELAAELTNLLERAGDVGLGQALAGRRTPGPSPGASGPRPDPALLAALAAIEVTAGAGGPAAAALEGLAAGLRDRHDTTAEAVALAAQARLSAIVVGSAPLLALAVSVPVDPRVAPTLVTTGPGRACLLAGAALESAAALWMGRIIRGGGR